jgi:Cys-rich repeat protein
MSRVAIAAVVALWAGMACDANPDAEKPRACRDDSECAAGEVCELPPDSQLRPTIVVPCYIQYQLCSEDVECPAGELCFSGDHLPIDVRSGLCPEPAGVCLPPCPVTLCHADEACGADGRCNLKSCDEVDVPGCPEHWTCAPERAGSEPATPARGGIADDTPAHTRAIARGCARLHCDEPDGFVCKQHWECDPANATDPSGCVALPCEVIGQCSRDSDRICAPSSAAPRPAGEDEHGCVYRNCEEGRSCQNQISDSDLGVVDIGACEPSAVTADAYGCVALPCELSGGACSWNAVCEPGSPLADERGCRPATCADGLSCREGSVCDPSSSLADARGCVSTGAGGSAGYEPPNGRCAPR